MKAIGFSTLFIFTVLANLPAMAIMNGRDADLNKSVATIQIYPEKAVRRCTAVIVAPNLLFTAGHCTEGIQKQVIRVEASNKAEGSRNQVIRVMQWRTAPGYTESDEKEPEDIQFDFAFMRTRDNLLEMFGLTAEQLPAVNSSVEDLKKILAQSKTFKAYGYGRYSGSRDSRKKELNQSAEVVEDLKVIKTVSTETGAGVCEGDSGGGLFAEVNGKLVLLGNVSGIVSRKGCGSAESYAAYTWVHNHLCWVKKTSGIQVGKVLCDSKISKMRSLDN